MKLLVTVVVAIVTILEDSHEKPGLILDQILVQNVIITTLLRTMFLIMIVIDLDMINKTKLLLTLKIVILALILIQPDLVVNINLTLVPVNALLTIKSLVLEAINHHTAVLLNHALIATEAALTITNGIIQMPNINLLSILLNNQIPIFISLSLSKQPTFERKMYHPNTSTCS